LNSSPDKTLSSAKKSIKGFSDFVPYESDSPLPQHGKFGSAYGDPLP
jgi:hypothetical protein